MLDEEGKARLTGFFVAPAVIATTDYSEQFKLASVRLNDGTTSAIRVVSSDSSTGVALLESEQESAPLALSRAEIPPFDSELFSFDRPAGLFKVGGRLSAYGITFSGAGPASLEVVGLAFAPGSGGTPVIDGTGAVIGMLYSIASETNRSYLVSSSSLRRAIESAYPARPS